MSRSCRRRGAPNEPIDCQGAVVCYVSPNRALEAALIALLLVQHAAMADDIRDELSAYGTFNYPPVEISRPQPVGNGEGNLDFGLFDLDAAAAPHVASLCALTFRFRGGREVAIGNFERCPVDGPSDLRVALRNAQHTLVTGAPEFHIFTSWGPGANGRYATCDYGADVVAVVVTSDDAKATLVSEGCASLRLNRVQIVEGQAMVIEQPSTTTDEGRRIEVSMSGVKDQPLPTLPSRVIKSEIENVVGVFDLGYKLGEVRFISADGGERTVQRPGECPTDSGQLVRVRIRVDDFDDGRRERACVEAAPVEVHEVH